MVLGYDGGKGLVHCVHRDDVHMLLVDRAELQVCYDSFHHRRTALGQPTDSAVAMAGTPSELQPHTDLQQPPRRSRQNARDASEVRPCSQAVRTAEIGVIRKIEKIASELKTNRSVSAHLLW